MKSSLNFVCLILTLNIFIACSSKKENSNNSSTPANENNKVSIQTLEITNVSTSAFDVRLNFLNDENSNSTAKLFYCNQTDNIGCDPLLGTELNLTKNSNHYALNVSGLTSPNDPGDVLKIRVRIQDADLSSDIILNTNVILQAATNATTVIQNIISDVTSTTFKANATYSGDSNQNATALLYYCNATTNASCDPLAGTSVSLDRFGFTFSKSITATGVSAGQNIKTQIVITDTDGVSGPTLTSQFQLNANLSSFPNVNDLAAGWTLNLNPASDGSTFNDLIGGLTGTLITNDGATNKFEDGGIRFDGNDDKIRFNGSADYNLSANAPFSMVSSFKKMGTVSQGPLFVYSTSSLNSVIGLSFADDTSISYWDGSAYAVTHNVPLVDNTWYHVVFTREGTTGRLYLNGVLVATNTVNASAVNHDSFEIGGDNYNTYSNIIVRNVSYWKRTLTSEEIYQLFENQN